MRFLRRSRFLPPILMMSPPTKSKGFNSSTNLVQAVLQRRRFAIVRGGFDSSGSGGHKHDNMYIVLGSYDT